MIAGDLHGGFWRVHGCRACPKGRCGLRIYEKVSSIRKLVALPPGPSPGLLFPTFRNMPFLPWIRLALEGRWGSGGGLGPCDGKDELERLLWAFEGSVPLEKGNAVEERR